MRRAGAENFIEIEKTLLAIPVSPAYSFVQGQPSRGGNRQVRREPRKRRRNHAGQPRLLREAAELRRRGAGDDRIPVAGRLQIHRPARRAELRRGGVPAAQHQPPVESALLVGVRLQGGFGVGRADLRGAEDDAADSPLALPDDRGAPDFADAPPAVRTGEDPGADEDGRDRPYALRARAQAVPQGGRDGARRMLRGFGDPERQHGGDRLVAGEPGVFLSNHRILSGEGGRPCH